MKKFLLTMAVGLLGLGAANAETVTFDFLTNDYGMTRLSGSTQEYNPNPTTVSSDGINITLSGNTRLWSDGVRFYKGSSFTVSGANKLITEVVIYNKNGTSVQTSNFSLDSSSKGTFSNGEWTSTAGEESVKINCTVAKGNQASGKLVITYKELGTPGKEDAGISFPMTQYTATLNSAFESPVLNNPNNLSVTYSSSDEAVATVAADGKVTLVGDGETTITATSEETDKFYAGKASYTLAVAKAANNVKEFIALGDGNVGKVNFPMTVAFVNNKNIFAVDAEGDFIQVYGANSYKANDVIPAGWVGTYKYFNSNTPEIMPVGDLPASTETAVFTPKTVTAADINNSLVNNVVVLKNVEFAAATPSTKDNFEGIVDGQTLSFRNNYAIAGVEAGIYDVTIVVTIYKDAPSLYVISYKEVAELADAPKITVDGQEFGDGNTINGEDEVTVVFPEVAEGQSIWYKTSTKTETRAAEEGFSKLEGNELKLDNTIDSLSYYVGDAEGTPVTKIATVKVDIFTAVEGIEAEAGVATYYDLNGRVVKGQLEKGIYVKVANGKASKVIVK